MTSWSRKTVETMVTVDTVETVERVGGDCGDVGDSGDGEMVSCWSGDGGWRPCPGGWIVYLDWDTGLCPLVTVWKRVPEI